MKRRVIYFDGEFCHLTSKGVKFLSMGFITDTGKTLYLELDQPESFVDPWVKENVLPHLTSEIKLSETEAKDKILEFIKDNYGEDNPILIADTNQFDWMGICELFGVFSLPFFYILLDLSTKIYTNNYDLDINRELLAENLGINIDNLKNKYDIENVTLIKHNALYDSIILKEIWEALK